MKLIFLLFLFSCSSLNIFTKGEDKEVFPVKKISVSEKDYLDHLKNFKETFVTSSDTKTYDLSNSSKRYLSSIAQDISQKNELFFTSKNKVEFEIVESKIPFHFSLPGGTIFLSSGLINKYIKSEKLLYCVISFELIR